MLMRYDHAVDKALTRPGLTIVVIMASFVVEPRALSALGLAFFPRTDPGQFVINVKAPDRHAPRADQPVHRAASKTKSARSIPKDDLQMIVSNIGITPDLSVHLHQQLRPAHGLRPGQPERRNTSTSSFDYMDRVRRKLAADLPEISTYFQTGGLVDSVVNRACPRPSTSR